MAVVTENYVQRAAPGVISIAVGIALWSLASRFLVGETLLPGPLAVIREAVVLVASGVLLQEIGVSLTRIAVGYALGVMTGIVTGLLLGGVRSFDIVLGPIFRFVKGIPPIAIVPLMIMWFGIGELPKYIVVAFIVWVIITVNVVTGVQEMPVIRLRAAQFMGLGRTETFVRVVLPSAAAYLVSGMRSSIGFAYIALVSAEIVAAQHGIGYMIMESRFALETERMIVGIIVLGLLGTTTQILFDIVTTRSHWVARYARK